MHKKLDILIVGGGMVGLTMAAALSDTDLQIGIIEKSDLNAITKKQYLSLKQPSTEQFETRVSAISPGNQKYLTKLQVWSKIPQCRISYYEKMAVWDGSGKGSIHFDASELAQPHLGAIVENQVLCAALYETLQNKNNIHLFSNTEINHIFIDDQQVDVEINHKQTLTTALLIGADGAHSTVRNKLAIGSSHTPYQQQAFVTNVYTEKSHQDTAWQCFTQHGPVALLPLAQPNLCSIVWSVDNKQANHLQQLTNEEFAHKLECAFELKLGNVQLVKKPQAFPLIKRHSETYLVQRCALIGDAAHTIHPLAGQGVNLGFQDVASLSQQIHHQLNNNRDFSLQANLRAFERERKMQNYLMQNAMSGFKWLFGKQTIPITLLRNYAMSSVDKSVHLKHEFIRHAMGL